MKLTLVPWAWLLVAAWSLAWAGAFMLDEHPRHWDGHDATRLVSLIAVPSAIVALGQWIAHRFERFLESLEGE